MIVAFTKCLELKKVCDFLSHLMPSLMPFFDKNKIIIIITLM